MLAPAALAFGVLPWDLPGSHVHSALAIPVVYILAAILLLRLPTDWTRPGFAGVVAIGIGALAALYLALLLVPSVRYSRPLLLAGSLLLVLGLTPLGRRSWKLPVLLSLPAALVVGSLALAASDGWERWIGRAKVEATSVYRVTTEYLHTSRHPLIVERHSEFLPATRTDRVVGGAITQMPPTDGYLLALPRGPLYLMAWGPDGEVELEALETAVPVNGNEFDDDVGPQVDVTRFRVADVLAWPGEGGVRVLASHHFWHASDDCFTIRLSGTTLKRADGRLRAEPWDTVYETRPCLPIKAPGARGMPFAGTRSGGELWRLPSGRILMTVGDQQFDGLHADRVLAQDPDADYGKVLAIDPVRGTASVHSSGHRNPQGIVADTLGRLWSTDHGPEGGDELNRLREGRNYGWPYRTHGTLYGDVSWPLERPPEGYEPPIYAWVPSIAISSLVAMASPAFQRWRGDLIAGSLAGRSLFRIVLEGERVAYVERIELGSRVRDLVGGSDGELVVWTDDRELLRIRPAAASEEGIYLYAQMCGGCHRLDPSFRRPVGPNLRGVVGRAVAGSEWDRYSSALTDLGGRWTEGRLDRFISDPDAFAPGTTMDFAGVADSATRRRIIDYLKSLDPAR